jgi:hypothetical protein
MRRLLPILLLSTGCAGPDAFRDDPTSLSATERRELDLQKNLRDGRSWAEQERLMGDVRGAFGGPSGADALGPGGRMKARGSHEPSAGRERGLETN